MLVTSRKEVLTTSFFPPPQRKTEKSGLATRDYCTSVARGWDGACPKANPLAQWIIKVKNTTYILYKYIK